MDIRDRYRLFIDFDGTITAVDLGYEMFRRFTMAQTEPLVQQYRRGEINSLQCLGGECEIWNNVSPDPVEVYSYIEAHELSEGFEEFVKFLENIGIEPLILSEGFDFYIDAFLKHHGYAAIPRISNKATYSNGLLTPHFPYFGIGCKSCSNCKAYHINQERQSWQAAIFIGDGHSDRHASAAADIVFAKSHLAEMLNSESKPFFEYESFYDTIPKLKDLISRGVFVQSRRTNLCFSGERHREFLRTLWENGDVMANVGYPSGLGLTDEQYTLIWQHHAEDKSAIYLTIENFSGLPLGEAKIAAPDSQGLCRHDLKLMPQYWGKGLAEEIWNVLLERSRNRWPESAIMVTPSIDNERAIRLYLKLGFQFDSNEEIWIPSPGRKNAISFRYRPMTIR